MKDIAKNQKENENTFYINVKDKLTKFYNNYKFMFIFTLIVGILTHIFMLSNKLPNHDDIQSLLSKGVTYELGRWGLELIKYIFPNYSMPWLNGIIMLILIALSACFVSKILKIDSKLKQCLIGSIMITYTSITCTLAYMFTANAYGISILLAILCVYFAQKDKNKINIAISIICLVLSIGIYQAYISITITLFMIILIKDCINKDKKIKDILKQALKFILIMIISLIIYLVITKVCNLITNTNLSNYQGVSSIGNISIISILKGIINSYLAIPRMIFRDFYGISAGIILKIGYAIVVIISGIYAILHFKEILKIDIKKFIIYTLLILMLPIGMNIMYILNSNIEIHSLMQYGNFLLLLIPFVLEYNLKKGKLLTYTKNIIVITLILMIFKYITYANECYLKLKLSYENTYSFYTSLVTRIENIQGFDENTKVALIGNYKGEMLNDNSKYFEELDDFTGIFSNTELINAYSKENFIKYYIGVDLNYATEEEIEKISSLEEFINMDIYPYDNSIKKIDNIIVVKFSLLE